MPPRFMLIIILIRVMEKISACLLHLMYLSKQVNMKMDPNLILVNTTLQRLHILQVKMFRFPQSMLICKNEVASLQTH